MNDEKDSITIPIDDCVLENVPYKIDVIAFSPKGRYFATYSSRQEEVLIWNLGYASSGEYTKC